MIWKRLTAVNVGLKLWVLRFILVLGISNARGRLA